MTRRALQMSALVPLLVSGCFLDGAAGGSGFDAGAALDAGRPDASSREVDAGPTDAGPDLPVLDGGPLGADAGPDGQDAGPDGQDAGPLGDDAGGPPPDDDAGPVPVDAGPDAGTDAGRDAGPPPLPDAGPADCAVLFAPLPGAGYNIRVCGSNADECRINFDSRTTCEIVCRGRCLEVHDNINKTTQVCSPRNDNADCGAEFNNAICTCGRP